MALLPPLLLLVLPQAVARRLGAEVVRRRHQWLVESEHRQRLPPWRSRAASRHRWGCGVTPVALPYRETRSSSTFGYGKIGVCGRSRCCFAFWLSCVLALSYLVLCPRYFFPADCVQSNEEKLVQVFQDIDDLKVHMHGLEGTVSKLQARVDGTLHAVPEPPR